MKKYLPYLLVIVVLAAAAIWFIKHQSKGTINEQEGDFAVKESKDIFKIILSDTENNKVEIAQVNGLWMVNNKYAAREELVTQLIDAITRVTSLCPVPTAAHDNVTRDLLAQHVQVQVYNRKDELMKSYWVGGPSIDGQNTYMLLELDGKPAVRPHMTYIPGFRGYLTPRFNTSEENWRSRVLYNYKEDEIKTLRVEYPADPMKSFSLTRVTSDSFSLSPLDEKFRINEPYQQKFIRQYLGFYSSIYIEAFDNSYSKRDSVMQTVPYCNITITGTDNSVNHVKLFYMPVSKRSKLQFDEKGHEMTYDIDHYYASIHNGQDFAIVQYYVLGKLLRNYRDFYFKPKQ
ncbi:MAG: hypothetical protein U0T74_04980 [Chitinophagales bacterium]